MPLPIDVSVIVALYNQAPILSVTLPDILDQDYHGQWEVIVCDDGSTDGAGEVVREIATRTPTSQCLYIWQRHSGSRRAANRNNGIRQARGSVLIFIDADIFVSRTFISSHLEYHRQDGVPRLVYGPRGWLFVPDFKAKSRVLSPLCRQILVQPALYARLYSEESYQKSYADTPNSWMGCMASNMSVSRNRTIGFDENFQGWGFEDQELACRLAVRLGYRLEFQPSTRALHLETTARHDYHMFRPKDAKEIHQYIQSLLYFRRLYPEVDTVPVCSGLGLLNLDKQSGRWERASYPCFDRSHLEEMIRNAEEWALTL